VIPLSVLAASPFNLIKGNSIFAKIQAQNYYGLSPVSQANNGALMAIVPDAPINLQETVSVTSRTQIEFTWSDGLQNGGSPVIDYRVSFD